MNNSPKIQEKTLHKIWKKQDFSDELISDNGDAITILNPGEYNKDTVGPDFKHARIKIGNLTFVGDIEIDLDYADWKNHGHNINKHYNKTILHLCYTNKRRQNYVYTAEGRKVNSISIYDKVSIDDLVFEIKLAGKNPKTKSNNLKCSSDVIVVDEEPKRKFILELGINRFQNKCDRIYRRLKELKFLSSMKVYEPVIRYELTKEFHDKKFSPEDFKEKQLWQQLLYELVFEALGYSKNKNMMMKLAQNANIKFLQQYKEISEYNLFLESALFNISGLMPDIDIEREKDSDYLSLLAKLWENINTKYDGKRFNETQWHFLGQRPQNFPTIRISGGAKILESIINRNLVGVLIKKFSELTSTKVLINSIRSLFIIKATSYWKEHYVFEKTSKVKLNYLIGLNRADEIFINVLLPYLAVYFDVFGNESLSRKVLKVYNEYEQKSENSIVRKVTSDLKLEGFSSKAIYSQGMLELYRNYCTKNKCLECEIGKIVFN
ncbi:MAG: DUF2851 family protein [Melioribacteraceae bacterium]|nr:DUF2851 family protein [Melioribacteraceae bacterium]